MTFNERDVQLAAAFARRDAERASAWTEREEARNLAWQEARMHPNVTAHQQYAAACLLISVQYARLTAEIEARYNAAVRAINDAYFQTRQEQQSQQDRQRPAAPREKTTPPVEFKQLWYGYVKQYHPDRFVGHPRLAEIDDLCKQVNAAYDRRSASFPQELACIQVQAEKIVTL